MDEYIVIPTETNPADKAQKGFDAITAVYPKWEPKSGDPLTVMIETIAAMAAEGDDVAAMVERSIYMYFGANLANVPPVSAAPAIVTSTWTARDNLGYTIPAGTNVSLPGPGGVNDPQGFQVQNDVVIPAGQTETAAGAVTLVAVVAGSAGNNLSGPAKLQDALDYVTDIAIVGQSANGVDAESIDDYLNRLRGRLRLQAPRPILPGDFAEMLLTSITGIFRVTVLDKYIPANQGNPPQVQAQTDVARAVTFVGIDELGNNLSGATKNAGIALLQSEREVDFEVYATDPSYTSIDVNYNADAWPGQDTNAVLAQIATALGSFLNPATWGSIPGTGEAPQWYNTPVVTYTDVATVIKNVPGVRRIRSLTIGIHGQALGAGDIDLSGTGPAPLPLEGTIAGQVNPTT